MYRDLTILSCAGSSGWWPQIRLGLRGGKFCLHSKSCFHWGSVQAVVAFLRNRKGRERERERAVNSCRGPGLREHIISRGSLIPLSRNPLALQRGFTRLGDWTIPVLEGILSSETTSHVPWGPGEKSLLLMENHSRKPILDSILFSIIPIKPQYARVVSILFSIIPIKPQHTTAASILFFIIPLNGLLRARQTVREPTNSPHLPSGGM